MLFPNGLNPLPNPTNGLAEWVSFCGIINPLFRYRRYDTEYTDCGFSELELLTGSFQDNGIDQRNANSCAGIYRAMSIAPDI